MAISVAEIEQAINNILLTGQSYSRPGLTVSHANIDILYDMLKTAKAEAVSSGDYGRFKASDFNESGGGSNDDFDD